MPKKIGKQANFALIILVMSLCVSCSNKFLIGTIYMGSGGGFAGSSKEYQLNANGAIFLKKSNVDSMFYLKTIDSSLTKKFFRKYYKLKFDHDNLDAPGNIFYYIGRKEGKFRNHKVTFGNPEAKVKKEVRAYYNEFIHIVSDSTISIKN